MVCDVSGDDVRDCPNRDGVVTGDPAPRPRLVRHVLEKRDGRRPDRLKFLDQTRPRPLIRIGEAGSNILIKTRHRVLKTPREPERSTQKQPLTVVHMV